MNRTLSLHLSQSALIQITVIAVAMNDNVPWIEDFLELGCDVEFKVWTLRIHANRLTDRRSLAAISTLLEGVVVICNPTLHTTEVMKQARSLTMTIATIPPDNQET